MEDYNTQKAGMAFDIQTIENLYKASTFCLCVYRMTLMRRSCGVS